MLEVCGSCLLPDIAITWYSYDSLNQASLWNKSYLLVIFSSERNHLCEPSCPVYLWLLDTLLELMGKSTSLCAERCSVWEPVRWEPSTPST